MSALRSKRWAASSGKINIKKKGQMPFNLWERGKKKNSPVWGGRSQDGEPSHPPPPPQRSGFTSKTGGFGQSSHFPMWRLVPKVARGPDVKVMWQVRNGVKVAISPPIPQWVVLARNLFRRGIFFYFTAVSKFARLFPVSCENGYSAYIVNPPLYKLRGGEIHSQSASLQSRATSPRRVVISNNKAGHISTHWTVSSLLFSCRKYCCCIQST